MEKVRAALEVFKKYHFWILLSLIVLITFGTWYMATADRAEQYTKCKTEIEGQFTSMNQITTKRDHPSENYNNGLGLRESGLLAGATDDAIKASEVIKTPERESWPATFPSAAEQLFDGRCTTFELPPIYPNNHEEQVRFEEDFWKVWNHKIEDIEKPPADAPNKDQYELKQVYRLQYRDQIKDIFPSLFEMIELRTSAEPGANAGGGEGRGDRFAQNGPRPGDDPSKQVKGVVDWADAGKLMDYFHNWNDIPTTPDVIVAQENVWVYEALLKVIRNTNDAGKDPKHNPKNYLSPGTHKDARIKEIQALEIGNEATASWAACENAVFVLSSDGGSATSTQAPTIQAGSSAGRGMGFQSAAAAAVSGGSANSLLIGRYVDNSGKPLADPTQQPNQEFRMMPVNLRVVMEQRAIPRLLVECANSNMRIDVRSVRILAEKPPAFDVNGSSTGGDAPTGATAPVPQLGRPPAGGRRGMSGFGGHGMMNRLGNQGSGNAAQNNEFSYTDESADPSAPPVPVEIQGVIYIYNPPTPPSANGAAAGATATGAPPPAAAAPAALAAPAAAGTATPPTATPAK